MAQHTGQRSEPQAPPEVSIGGVALFVLAVNIVGALPAVVIDIDVAWLDTTPWYFPPTIVFPVAWTLLFTLMGVAAYLVWRHGSQQSTVRTALAVFLGQLILNIAWTPAFFGLQQPGVGMAIILLLWLGIGATIRLFARVDRWAALLLVPYLLWVTYAAGLNVIVYLQY